jgi:uncharacterized protein (DUF1778 family)
MTSYLPGTLLLILLLVAMPAKKVYPDRNSADSTRKTDMPATKSPESTSPSRGRITARVSQNVQDVLQLAADIVGSTMNQFVTQAALEKAEKIVERERLIRMSENDFSWFFNALDNPPPSTSLVDAFTQYNARKGNKDEGSASVLEFGA